MHYDHFSSSSDRSLTSQPWGGTLKLWCIISPLEVGNLKYLFVCSLAHYWLFWSILTVCEGDKVSVVLRSGCSGHRPTSIWLGSMRGFIVDQLWSTDTDRAYFIQTRSPRSLLLWFLHKRFKDMFDMVNSSAPFYKHYYYYYYIPIN